MASNRTTNGNSGTLTLTVQGGKTAADAIKIKAPDIQQPATLNTQIYYSHNDHLGTPQVITDNAQNIVWGADYEPFGETSIYTQTIANNLRFPGQYFDEESSLHYNYFRDYDPTTGRYVQSDPVGITKDFSAPRLQVAIAAGMLQTRGNVGEALNHLFGYVGQNPLGFYDPYGLHKADKLFGLPKKFWRWYHRNEKRPGDPDLDRESAEVLHKEWKDRGEPGPDSKSDKGDLRGWLIPPAIELACIVDPCNSFCAAWAIRAKTLINANWVKYGL